MSQISCSGAELVSDVLRGSLFTLHSQTRCSLPWSLHGKIKFNGRMPLSTRINKMSSTLLTINRNIPRVGTDDNPTKPFSKVGNSNFRTTGDGLGMTGCPVSVFFLKPIPGAAYKRDLKSAIYDAFCLLSYLSCNEG